MTNERSDLLDPETYKVALVVWAGLAEADEDRQLLHTFLQSYDRRLNSAVLLKLVRRWYGTDDWPLPKGSPTPRELEPQFAYYGSRKIAWLYEVTDPFYQGSLARKAKEFGITTRLHNEWMEDRTYRMLYENMLNANLNNAAPEVRRRIVGAALTGDARGVKNYLELTGQLGGDTKELIATVIKAAQISLKDDAAKLESFLGTLKELGAAA